MENPLKECMDALRVLAKPNDTDRVVLVEININDFLKKAESDQSGRWLERLRRAIHAEEMANRRAEDWSIAKDHVRSLLHRMSEAVGSQISQREDETSV